MSRRNDYLDAKVYVGGLPEDATSQEVCLILFEQIYFIYS